MERGGQGVVRHLLLRALLDEHVGVVAVVVARVVHAQQHVVDAQVEAREHEEEAGHAAQAHAVGGRPVVVQLVLVQRHRGEVTDGQRAVGERGLVDGERAGHARGVRQGAAV